MELFHKIPHIDFMGQRKWTAALSIIVSIVCIYFLMTRGLNFGLDFTGGTQLELRYEQAVDFEAISKQLEESGFPNAKVTQYGTVNDILVKLANREGMSEQELGRQVVEKLKSYDDSITLRRVEFVGSEVGAHLAEQGGLAVLVSLIAIMIYIAMRFEYRFSVSAAVALMHDPVVILGVFAFFQIEFDLATLAAVLAVLGYSLNDSIVVFDRVRENFRKVRKGSAYEVVNLSINQTLSRTIMTSALTLLVVLALFFFGGESLHGFSTALLIGIVVGTYSSIYVSGALALVLGLSKSDLMASSKKFADDMP